MIQLADTVNARVRRNFSVQHLMGAARFSRQVGVIETENIGQPFGPFFDEIISYSTACIISAVAGLEAFANEVFADRTVNFPKISPAIIDQLCILSEQRSILDKFDLALTLLELPKTNRGVAPAQHVAILIRLRNGLTHFKPEWHDEERAHAKLSSSLNGLFEGSPHFATENLFPRRWMTHGATCWAVTTATNFLREFEQQAGLPTKLQNLAALAP